MKELSATSAKVDLAPANNQSHRLILRISIVLFIALLFGMEMKSSWLQSRVLSAVANKLTFTLGRGASDEIQYSSAGPYDERLGYTHLPSFLSQLQSSGFRLESQARESKMYFWLGNLHIYPIYQEKAQAGLEILDRDDKPFYKSRYPLRAYEDFDEIPPIIVRTVLFVENRDILDSNYPYRNPAIGWGRLSRAVVDFGLHQFDHKRPMIGGSTLATQLEKMRHSPGGRTHSLEEKLRQITTASLRAYRGGPETMSEQQRIVLDYINSIPLAATPAQGEVTGLGDGLWTWYGANFPRSNVLLSSSEDTLNEDEQTERAIAYREALSLLLALRAPSQYLVRDPAALAKQTDRYLLLLCKQGIISQQTRDLAFSERPSVRPAQAENQRAHFIDNKAPDTVRAALLPMLGLKDTYALDRLDLSVSTGIDNGVEQKVKNFLVGLKDPEEVQKIGLQQYQLLSSGDPRAMIYSFVLYERKAGENILRVQTDDYDQPLSINQGTKLQLGSTAKLRTLINYLEIVEKLHDQYQGMSPAELSSVNVELEDHITAWAINYFQSTRDKRLVPMLQAAMDRTYSGNPSEGFFTAGGLQSFGNFLPEENAWVTTVRQAFEQSVNLIFIRLMRDIEQYYLTRLPDASLLRANNESNQMRSRYLARFADQEGRVFLREFYEKYYGRTEDQSLELLVRGIHPTPQRLAAIYRFVRPGANLNEFSEFLKVHLVAISPPEDQMEKLYVEYAPDKFNLSDRGYLAHVHPLEIWLLKYLEQHPQAPYSELVAKSANQRQEVYSWLIQSSHRGAQDRRIKMLLEEDAFKQIWAAWKRQGYPFDSLVPSYATAIGVSGDTPAALAELMGIILNNGIRYPNVTVRELRFAKNTPLEAVLRREPGAGQRVMSPEIAALVHQELIQVVERGTARRAQGGIRLGNGAVIPVGGKTGTGDNQFKVFGRGGYAVSSQSVNRTATFAFLVGDRFYGTVLAYVPGKSAEDYEFTSSLAVQIFKDLEPTIKQLLERNEE
ncbi:MAG TPA: transglycosylase domain-containing protein [Candidatus Acidoferrales bacterium]